MIKNRVKLQNKYLTNGIVKKLGLKFCDALDEVMFKKEIRKIMRRYSIYGLEAIRAKILLCELNDNLKTLEMFPENDLHHVNTDLRNKKIKKELIKILKLKDYISDKELEEKYVNYLLTLDFDDDFKAFLRKHQDYGIINSLYEGITYRDISECVLIKLFISEELTPDILTLLLKTGQPETVDSQNTVEALHLPSNERQSYFYSRSRKIGFITYTYSTISSEYNVYGPISSFKICNSINGACTTIRPIDNQSETDFIKMFFDILINAKDKVYMINDLSEFMYLLQTRASVNDTSVKDLMSCSGFRDFKFNVDVTIRPGDDVYNPPLDSVVYEIENCHNLKFLDFKQELNDGNKREFLFPEIE